MDLSGKELGRYRVVSLLGSGGMGAVYDALDSTLGRHVALKILPPHVLTDQSRVRRFVQEARAASSLNHPHLVAIYDIGTHTVDGTEVQFIAMEKIEGTTLREVLAGRQLPLKRALDLMGQITDAVAAAHGAGIVHRDLKPENVMVSTSGYAKVLDFGLAKLQDDSGAHTSSDDSPTAVMSTKSGVVVGTAGYMSPEQAAGRAVDHRSDIFSLGCLLYEMTSGRRAFRGESTVDTLHKIIHDDPEPLHLGPVTPAELQRIVRKALAKEPDERYQSARDLAIDVRGLLRDIDSSPSTERVAAQRSSPKWLAIAAMAAAVLLIGGAISWYSRRSAPPAEKRPLSMQRLTTQGDTIHAALSPDAKLLAFVTSNEKGQSLSVRQLASGQDLQIVAPQRVGFWGVSFTPDGNTLLYAIKGADTPRNGAFFRVSTLGGASERVVESIDCPPAISPDGKRIAWQRSDLPTAGQSAVMVANIDGSDAKVLASRRDPDQFAPLVFTSVAWSPDGTMIATPVARRTEGLGAKLLVIDVATRKETVMSDGWWGVGAVGWVPDQTALIMTAMTRDSPVPQPNLWRIEYPSGERRQLTNDLSAYRSVSVTADGRALATVVVDITTFVSTLDLRDGSRPVRISEGKQDGRTGVAFTPDGHIVYSSVDRVFRLMIANADGTDKRPLVKDVYQSAFPAAYDGGLVHGVFDGKTTMIRSVDWNGESNRVIVRGSDSSSIAVSKDGKWIVYPVNRRLFKSDMSGNATPLGEMRGGEPVFSADGTRLAYIGVNEYVILEFATGKRIWSTLASTRAGSSIRFWPDGKSIVVTDYKADRSNLYRIDLATSTADKLTNFDDLFMYPFDISADGTKIVFARGRLTRDAVLVTGF